MSKKLFILGLCIMLVMVACSSDDVTPPSSDNSFVGGGCGLSVDYDEPLSFPLDEIVKAEEEFGGGL